jgi:hypothetical protein
MGGAVTWQKNNKTTAVLDMINSYAKQSVMLDTKSS